MENEKKGQFITGFLLEFAKIFTLIIIVMSFTGKIVTNYYPDAQNVSSLFALGSAGLPYPVIFQLAGLAIVLTIFSRLLFSSFLEAKMPYLLRVFLLLVANLFTTSIFVLSFKWFPLDNIWIWLTFFLASFISSAIAVALSILLVIFENKKYNKLLENYKKRHTAY